MALGNQFEDISRYIRENAESLLRDLKRRVRRSGIAFGSEAEDKANELLSDVTIEALENADRYDPTRPLPNWLAGISNMLILRMRTGAAKQARREPLVGDMPQAETLSEEEIFTLLAEPSLYAEGPESDYATREVLAKALARLSPDDQRVIRNAILLDMNGEQLAEEMKAKPGAVRVRLHRAIGRLHGHYMSLLDGER